MRDATRAADAGEISAAAFARRWAVCFLLATGITALSASTVQVAVFAARLIATAIGLPGIDGALRSVC